MFKHTYLLQPGLWEVEGHYFDGEENRHEAKGQILMTHGPDLWTMESQIKISGQDRRDFLSRYEITPLADKASFTEWKSQVGGPEPIYGLFVLVEDTVMMPWQSSSGVYWGQECLGFKTPDEYQGRGFAFLKNQKASAWAFRLTRLSDGV
ncbi:MAG: hypothetical protein LBI10_13135 [Deltaproteobacteria bacterium]|nr:hypothetical protein [Deltaproteobacteria bacterium]